MGHGNSLKPKHHWAICDHCEGNGTKDHPAFSNGITSEEWNGPDWDEESQQNYLAGVYDVPCDTCKGSGKVQIPIIALLTFAEKRELVQQRRSARFTQQWQREIDNESRMLGEH